MQAVYGAIWGNWLDEVGKARPKSKLAAYVGNPVAASNAAQGDLGKAPINAGLIDRLGDRTAFGIHVAKFAGVEDDDLPGSYKDTELAAYARDHPMKDDGKIGVVTEAGELGPATAASGSSEGENRAHTTQEPLAQKTQKR